MAGGRFASGVARVCAPQHPTGDPHQVDESRGPRPPPALNSVSSQVSADMLAQNPRRFIFPAIFAQLTCHFMNVGAMGQPRGVFMKKCRR